MPPLANELNNLLNNSNNQMLLDELNSSSQQILLNDNLASLMNSINDGSGSSFGINSEIDLNLAAVSTTTASTTPSGMAALAAAAAVVPKINPQALNISTIRLLSPTLTTTTTANKSSTQTSSNYSKFEFY